MPTEMELTLEQTQQGVSYEVSNIRVISIIMKMEILLEPTSNKLMVGSGYQQKDRKPSQNDKTEHGMEKTVQNQGQSPKMSNQSRN
ncbi:hypothetical protein Tco_0818771 [Tanacetum coccineum]